ncbi:LXG domain-containing protein [Terribacillus saccharophilus]|uniref:T7SS effector LXG polymorphic toxin n=1 Tax=Terribacillus saccharophilus TaxID=361277 RepID=UPI003981EBB5
MKNLVVQDIQKQVDSTKDFIKQMKESVEQVKQAINGVTTLHDGFEGKSADSIRSFFEETHKPFLEFLNSFLIQYEETLSSVYEEVLSFESDEQGFIREEFLEGELKSELVKASTSLTTTSIEINQQLLYVKDIAHIPSIDNDPFIESINKGKEKLKETLSNMYDMDANATKKLEQPLQDIEQMKAYLAKLGDAIDKNNITVDSYSSEQLKKLNFYQEFDLSLKGKLAQTEDKTITLSATAFQSLKEEVKNQRVVVDPSFEHDGTYYELSDGSIIREYQDNTTGGLNYQFVKEVPKSLEVKASESEKEFWDKVLGPLIIDDAKVATDPDAPIHERILAGASLTGVGKITKAPKLIDKFVLKPLDKFLDDIKPVWLKDGGFLGKKADGGKNNKDNEQKKTQNSQDTFAGNINTRDIPNMSKKDILDNIPQEWQYTEHNKFVHVRDSKGNIRMRIDPPDKLTKYDHVHLYDEQGNPLDKNLSKVDRKSPDAHIPYKK